MAHIEKARADLARSVQANLPNVRVALDTLKLDLPSTRALQAAMENLRPPIDTARIGGPSIRRVLSEQVAAQERVSRVSEQINEVHRAEARRRAEQRAAVIETRDGVRDLHAAVVELTAAVVGLAQGQERAAQREDRRGRALVWLTVWIALLTAALVVLAVRG
jgi:hypothetical protein